MATITDATLSPQTPAHGIRGDLLIEKIPDLLLRAGRKSFWPLFDQGVVSAGNFLTLVLVARALPAKSEYGQFGLILEIIFYVNTLQSALITYPLTVKGAVADGATLRRLSFASLAMTMLVALPVALIGLGIAAASDHLMLGFSAAFALVAWQAQDIVRKSLIAEFRYAAAVVGDTLRYVGTAVCVFVLWKQEWLTLTNVFLVIGMLSLLALAVQAIQVSPRAVGVADFVSLAREFVFSGRWMLLTSASAIVISICGVWTLSLFHGAAVVGEFYAVANFTKPINPIVIAFCGLILQHAARAYGAGGVRAAKGITIKLSGIMLALALPYLLALLLVPGKAMWLFYGADSHFREPRGEMALRLFALSFILFLFMSLIGAFLNGIGRTRDSFHAQIINSIATVAVALPLTIRFGLIGMIVGGAAAATVQFASMIYFFRKAT